MVAHIQAYYLASQPLRADSSKAPVKSDKPDKVHSGDPDALHPSLVRGKKAAKSQKGQVTIADVLNHKEGEEVWVVIKGDVYKYVLDLLFVHTVQKRSLKSA